MEMPFRTKTDIETNDIKETFYTGLDWITRCETCYNLGKAAQCARWLAYEANDIDKPICPKTV